MATLSSDYSRSFQRLWFSIRGPKFTKILSFKVQQDSAQSLSRKERFWRWCIKPGTAIRQLLSVPYSLDFCNKFWSSSNGTVRLLKTWVWFPVTGWVRGRIFFLVPFNSFTYPATCYPHVFRRISSSGCCNKLLITSQVSTLETAVI